MLIASLPWTEFGLRFTYLEATRQYDRFHAHSNVSVLGPSIWDGDSLEAWNSLITGPKRHPVLVVQSNTDIPAELVAERVEKLFAA